MRLPRKVTLPFGYVVSVVLVNDAQMLDAMDEDDPAELADGLWDVDNKIVYVRRNLPFKRKAEVLGHELDHALNDWRHWVGDRF